MRKLSIMKATSQKKFKKVIFGFDIETYNNNKDFLMCSLVNDDLNYQKVFYNKSDFIEEIKTNKIFLNSYIFATNLSFDFFGMFFDRKEIQNFKTLFRGSDLLYAKTFVNNGKFQSANIKYKKKKDGDNSKSKRTLPSITFSDTLNYAKLSVEKMGKIVNSQKLKTPSFIGQKPKNKEEWDEMIAYNIQDSRTTFTFAKFMVKATEELGATFKNTLASTTMSLFKNKYLEQDFIRLGTEDLKEIFLGYYGGRTEAFKRGYFSGNYNYYDFNSLYPSVMEANVFPDPNTHRVNFKNTIKYINDYEGVSHIRIEIPKDTKYPLLPFRQENGRVVFPVGVLEGWYSHIEIRKAIEEGAILIKVYKSHYFKKNIRPFKKFVNDLYTKRKEYQNQKNPMEYVTKIMLNSLYGKFGQRFTDKDNWIPKETVTFNQINSASSFEERGDFIRLVTAESEPSSFCIPIWAIYVTAYGRIKLHEAIKISEPIYCDTDSLITLKTFPCSSELGELKLEMEICEGVVVRPKFYALREKGQDEFCEGYVKIKGLGKRLNYLEFWGFLQKPTITYDKFTKFKESLRRELVPNEIIKVTKELSLEDEKRLWEKPFSDLELQEGFPLYVNVDIPTGKEKKLLLKANMFYEKEKAKAEKSFINSDLFDKISVGSDISYSEFLENEKDFNLY